LEAKWTIRIPLHDKMFKFAIVYLFAAAMVFAAVDVESYPSLTTAVEWPQAANAGGTVSLDSVPVTELSNAERLQKWVLVWLPSRVGILMN
jgi:hypothetical protein